MSGCSTAYRAVAVLSSRTVVASRQRNKRRRLFSNLRNAFKRPPRTNCDLIAPLSPHAIGRWFASLARGLVFHSDVGQVSPINHEVAIAALVHYTIGVTLALVYLLACSALGLSAGNPLSAFGLFVHGPSALVDHVSSDGNGWFGGTDGSARGVRLEPDCSSVAS